MEAFLSAVANRCLCPPRFNRERRPWIVFCYASGPMGLQKVVFFLMAAVVSAFAQDKNHLPVAERLAAQNALFDEQYESDLREFPERATSLGDYRFNDKLADRSLEAIARREKVDQGFLKQLEAISTTG